MEERLVGSRTSLHSAVTGSSHPMSRSQAKPSFGQSIEKPEKSVNKIAFTVGTKPHRDSLVNSVRGLPTRPEAVAIDPRSLVSAFDSSEYLARIA